MSRVRSAALALLLLAPAAAQAADAGAALRTRGTEFCFGRVYDAAHMAQHKRQPYAAIHVFKSFTDDPLSEDKPVTREERIAQAKKNGMMSISVVRRDRAGKSDDAWLGCGESRGRFQCSMSSEEYAHLNLELRPSGDGFLATSGLDREEVYRLAPLPMSQCLAARDAARPAWVGKSPPLRVRFAERAPVCLAAEGRGQVARVTLLIHRPTEIDPSPMVPHSMLRATVTMTLKDGTTRARGTRCDSGGYRYWCQNGYGEVYLVPAGERAITMFEVNAGDGNDKGAMETFFGLTLPKDERSFRLEEAELSACPQP
jgi:hypothetical protein